MFFYYTKTITSRWAPVKTSDKPSPKTADGCQKRPMSRIVELSPAQYDLPLERLSKIYPVGDL
jgi:hypothetical protein